MPRKDFDHESDSLDRIERLLAIEEALVERIRTDSSLSSLNVQNSSGRLKTESKEATFRRETTGTTTMR